MFEGSAYLMFGLAGGAYLSVGAYSRKYGIPQFSWGIFGHRMHLDQSRAISNSQIEKP